MTKRVKHPFETPKISRRRYKRIIEPLVRRFQEELRTIGQEKRRARKFPFRYDMKNDMLHLFVASSEGTISSPGYKGVYVDFDPATSRIVGMTILGFRKNILPQLEGAEDVIRLWDKIRWKLWLLNRLESFAGFFGITLEGLESKQVQGAVENWVDWYRENPTKLDLVPVVA